MPPPARPRRESDSAVSVGSFQLQGGSSVADPAPVRRLSLAPEDALKIFDEQLQLQVARENKQRRSESWKRRSSRSRKRAATASTSSGGIATSNQQPLMSKESDDEEEEENAVFDEDEDTRI